MKVRQVSPEEFESFVARFRDPLLQDLPRYEQWKSRLGILKGTFWSSRETGLALLGLEEGQKLRGVLRVLKVPFFERRQWGEEEKERGEIQDIFLHPVQAKALNSLLARAEEILSQNGLLNFGVSEWKKNYWEVIETLGFSPYARSVLIAWNTEKGIPKDGNPEVKCRLVSKREISALRQIQKSSWGFFIPPDFKSEDVLIAFFKDQPVGSAYLNRFTGNTDFGVHVMQEFQRRRVGTAILKEALRLYREQGAKRMFVTRVLRAITKINEDDRVALKFYLNCGGKVLREYRGFRRKKRPRPLELPPLGEFTA